MKKLTKLLWLTYFLLVGCKAKELSREEAFQKIQEVSQYPKVVDYDIYCSDAQHAQAVVEAGLEKAGLLTVQKTQKLSETGSDLIQFTSKAEPYLLATPAEDQELNVQKVKLAEEELIEVTGIITNPDGKSAIVEYSTTYKNVNPFAGLRAAGLSGKKNHKAYFFLQDGEWKLVQAK